LTPARFRKQSDHELDQLADEKLIAYVRDASSAKDYPAAKRALAILVYGHAANVERRMLLRMPRWAVQDAAHDALVRAITSAFDGTSEGEFHSWLNTITDRTAVDWFRRRGRRPEETLLPSEHAGDDEIWGDEPATASETGAVELQLILEEIVADLSPAHRKVIELHVLDGLSAAETCTRMQGMSPDNVAKIASRFRKRLRETLEAAEGGAGA
jgi:RNA polymerase sigma factor (sigma-70 family)